MWISRVMFEQLIEARAAATAVVTELKSQNVAQKTTMDWMMMRLTQLEHERAQLIHNYMGVKIEVPSIEPETPSVTTSDLLSQTMSFDDVGDDEAKKQGIDWDEMGRVVYGKR